MMRGSGLTGFGANCLALAFLVGFSTTFLVGFFAGCLRPLVSVWCEKFGDSELASFHCRTLASVLSSTFACLAIALFDFSGSALISLPIRLRFCSGVRWRR